MSKTKEFTCTRIILGSIKAKTEEEALDRVQNLGFNVGHITEHISPDNDQFWGNLTCDQIDDIRKVVKNLKNLLEL